VEGLARLAEKEPEAMTMAEIYDWAIAWARREALRLKIARGETPIQIGSQPPVRRTTRMAEDASIRRDEHDVRIAWCVGKPIYLGHDTQVSRLFWLLASPVGRAQPLAKVQRAIDGIEPPASWTKRAKSTRRQVNAYARRSLNYARPSKKAARRTTC
jgi:hypothetical protein